MSLHKSFLAHTLIISLASASLVAASVHAEKTRRSPSKIGQRLRVGTGQGADASEMGDPSATAKLKTKKAPRVARAVAVAQADDAAPTGRLRPSLVPAIVGPVAKVSTKVPGKLYFLLDYSGSMTARISGSQVSKAAALAQVVNDVVVQWIDRSRRGGVVAPRLDLEAIAYTGYPVGQNQGRGRKTVSLFSGPKSITELAEAPTDTISKTDGDGSTIVENIWVKPFADSGNPVNLGFEQMATSHAGWKRKSKEKHLVLVVHVTDGQFEGEDPRPLLAKFSTDVAAEGGQLLVTNIHLSANSAAPPVIFPTPADAARFDAEGQLLFEMSSPVPPEIASKLGTKPGARMMAFNSTLDVFAQVFQAGSSVAQ